jgi:hypothetical protein
MTDKHTPGPWGDKQVLIRGATFLAIAHFQSKEAEANARLIAAAPDLLEALKWMVENDETNTGDEPLDDHGGYTWNEINAYWIAGLNRARAAIAKATGGVND